MLAPTREFGVVAGCCYVINRALTRLSNQCGLYWYDLMAQPIATRPLLPEARLNGISYRLIRPQDPEVELMPARAEVKERRFRDGALCLGAFRGDRMLAFIWLAFGSYEEDEVRCTFALPDPDSSVFDFDLYVMPEFRLGVAFAALWHGVNRMLRERGVSFTYSRVSRFNVASRRSHERLGARRIAGVLFLKLWRTQLMMATKRPFVAISLSAKRRPIFQLRSPVG